MKIFIYGILSVCFVFTSLCPAAPEPAVVQKANEWTIDVSFEHIQQIEVQSDRNAKPKRFWYTIVTLTNKSGNDVDFYPRCDLMTDTFQVIPAGKKVPAVVFEQIKRRHQSKYPFLEPLEKTGNKILQGYDNTKDIPIIWPDFDIEAKKVSLFITGLSNEIAVIDHPTAKDEIGKAEKVFLRKTLELDYTVGGDPAFRSEARLVYKGKHWIMR